MNQPGSPSADRGSAFLVDARPVDHPTARQRGIGRYVVGLLTGLVDLGAPVVGLYGTESEADILRDSVPGLTLRALGPQTIREYACPGTWFVATQLMLHPVPLDPIPAIVTEARLPVAAVMYDVIPYRFPQTYLDEPNARRQADLRAPLARTVDSMLAISAFAATTSAHELVFPEERIGVIGAGVEARFAPPNDDPRERSAGVIPARVGPYVVAVTGGDRRKNTEGLIEAWAIVERHLERTHHLVIATGHSPEVRRRWELCAEAAGVTDRVVFTGAVDDDILVAVLQGAALAVMPSFEEGFGLPVLEAAACGVPTIASNLTSLPEVLDEPASTFDPHDPADMASAIVRGLSDERHRATLRTAAARAVERWTWTGAATATVQFLERTGPRWPQSIVAPRRHVAVAGSFEDGRRGQQARDVVDIVGRLPETEVTTLVDTSAATEPAHAHDGRWPCRSLGRFVKPWNFDHIVVVGSDGPAIDAVRAAWSVPCHIWLGVDAAVPAGDVLGRASSVIVGSPADAERVRATAPVPVVVLSDDAPDRVAAALVDWFAEVDTWPPMAPGHR